MKLRDETALRHVESRVRRRFRLPAIGLLSSMRVTLQALLTRPVTVHYPEERVELPPRTRGVIALLEENCTVCMLCSKECPCWCIYIEGHKEKQPGKRKAVNALDRFAIDFGLCMYCGICVEVCPFDALHWSPAFEYTAYNYEGLMHEVDVLKSWEYKVLPPAALVDDADEDLQKKTAQDAEKRAQGVYGVIREADKKEAYERTYGIQPAPSSQEASTLIGPILPMPRGEVLPAPAAPIQTAPAPAERAADSAAAAGAAPPAAPPGPGPQETQAETATGDAQEPKSPGAPAPVSDADLGGVPRIDPTNLPPGIGPVERGRLKKLAHFQQHGRTPPADLLENLKPILDQMRG